MATPIPPKDHKITLEEGVDITTRYRDSKPAVRTPTFVFNRNAFDRILAQDGCVGIRLYPALHDGAERQTVVLVGVDGKGSDMLDELSQLPEECPPICDPDSALMR